MPFTIFPDASIIIVSFNTRDLLRDCLRTVKETCSGLSYEIIVVDNASRDGSAAMVEQEFPEVRLIHSPINLGFAAANNRGFEIAQGRYFILLNSDAFLKPGALKTAIQHMDESPLVGLAGGRLVGRDGDWQPSARMFPSIINDFLSISGLSARFPKSRLFGRVDRTWADENQSTEVDWVPGAFSIISRDVLAEIGFFDERFFLYYEEVDLCKRMKQAGYKIWYWPDIEVVHLGGESSKTVKHLTMSKSGAQLTLWRMRSALLYYRKHHGLMGAWLERLLETSWHKIRAWKNSGTENADSLAKAADSQNLLSLMRQAWQETQGGRLSPPRPW